MGFLDGLLKKKEILIVSPVKGACVNMKEVPDPTFSENIIGKGVAFRPSEGKFYAPASGVITTLFPTLHAIGITTDEKVELLLHIGIDTVNLKGEFFKAHVSQGDTVKKGALLMEADLTAIEKAGYNTITPVIVCNTDDYSEIKMEFYGEVQKGDTVMQLTRA